MSNVLALTGRNLLRYIRDPLNVFFSLLGALIIFVLYTLFLGNLQVVSITESMPGADADLVKRFIDSWMFAGIISITSMTTPLGALSTFVEDGSTKRFQDFLVSPLKRSELVLGYLLSAFVIGSGMTLLVLAVSLLYLAVLSGVVLSLGAVLSAIGWTLLSVAGFAALWSFVISFIRTQGAFAGLSSLIGTIAGFVSGSYIAVGLFPEAVRNVVSALPFAHSSMLLRQAFTEDALSDLLGGHPEGIETMEVFYGMQLYVGDWNVPVWFAAALLAVVAVVFTWLASRRIHKRIA
ncbi:ABC transporter permease [Gulosibacter sp. 10]|uniref:ABC transporter permease n=1 Tax=Gulosibacter sp. 10 TaxID=1255570 RepID=UPI00097EAE69|nr:ABC transporter permease [Gulosibacter sp. 10]SJM64481.1 ABC transporter, permease protein [Gulosibacter sp. 10]